MAGASIFKALSRETKASILVLEYEARRLTIDQMRELLAQLVAGDEERRLILGLIENNLRTSGYQGRAIEKFIEQLTGTEPGAAADSPRPPAAPAEAMTDLNSEETVQAKPFGLGPAPVPAAGGPPKADPGVFFGVTATPVSKGRTLVMGPLPTLPGQASRTSSQTAILQASRANLLIPPASPGPGQPAAPRPSLGGGLGAQAVRTESEKPRVLLADDDPRVRIVFRLRLEKLGIAVVEAANGDEAWARLREGGLALAILDVRMPGLSGVDLVGRMVENKMDIPVIVCSAFDDLRDEVIAKRHPHLRYLVKPVSSEVMEQAVRQAVHLPAR